MNRTRVPAHRWPALVMGVAVFGVGVACGPASDPAQTPGPDAAIAPSTAPEPTVSDVSDPRQYVRDALMRSEDAAFEGIADYNIRDEAVLDEAIDKAMRLKRRKWDGELPHDQDELDRFIGDAERTWRIAQMDSDEHRALVEKRMEAYFAEPIVRVEGDTAHVDLGILPGPLKRVTRGKFGIRESPYADNLEVKPEEVQRAFQIGLDDAPEAKHIQVKAKIPQGSRPKIVYYRYNGDRDRLEIRSHRGKVYQSPEKIGGIEAIIEGRTGTRYADLLPVTAELHHLPWNDPWERIK